MSNEERYEDEVQTLPGDEFDDSELDGEQHDPSAYQHDDEQPQETSETSWNDQPAEQQYQPRPLDPLEQLPLELTLRCGSLTLALGDLRRVGAGTVLEVTGISPGHATLCHGERVVAEGELVDIDGRLGLQITRMASPA